MRPDENRHLLPMLSDSGLKSLEIRIDRSRKPIGDEGGVDQARIEIDNALAVLQLCPQRFCVLGIPRETLQAKNSWPLQRPKARASPRIPVRAPLRDGSR